MRKATRSGERAEDDVLAQLDRHLPAHWVVIGLIPPRRAREGERKYSCKEIDAIIVADRLIYVVEIKSHQGLVRVRSGHPFQLNGLDIKDSGNQGAGFWDNHDKQCHQLKHILRIKLGIPSSSIVPRFIWAGSPRFDYGSSDLDEHVTDCSRFIALAIAEDARSQCAPLSQTQVTALGRYLSDDEHYTAPARGPAKPATPRRPAAADKPIRASTPASPPAPPPSFQDFRRPYTLGPQPLATGPFVAPAPPPPVPVPRPPPPPPPPSAASGSTPAYSPPPPNLPSPHSESPPIGTIVGMIVGALVILGMLSELASCASSLVSRPADRVGPARVSVQSPPEESRLQEVERPPSYSVRPFPSPVRYLIESPDSGVWIQLGPGRDYASGPLLQHGEEVTGNGSTIDDDGVTWISVTGPNGDSGFIMDSLLRLPASPASSSESGASRRAETPPDHQDASDTVADPRADRASETGPPEDQLRAVDSASAVTCILPSGREARLDQQQCRQASGVIYRDEN